MEVYVVYVKTNEKDYITDVNSSAFLADVTDWTEIDQGHGDKYHHAQSNFLEKPIMTRGGAYRYRLVDKKLVECTPEEITEQEEANKPAPTPDDNLESRVATVESDVASLTAAIEKGLSL